MDSEKEANKFEPDFILLLEDKENLNCYHQMFVEPKGDWAKGDADNFDTTYYENPCYKVLGMPFWNSDTQDVFIDEFDSLLL